MTIRLPSPMPCGLIVRSQLEKNATRIAVGSKSLVSRRNQTFQGGNEHLAYRRDPVLISAYSAPFGQELFLLQRIDDVREASDHVIHH